jgi:hypothetical protein
LNPEKRASGHQPCMHLLLSTNARLSASSSPIQCPEEASFPKANLLQRLAKRRRNGGTTRTCVTKIQHQRSAKKENVGKKADTKHHCGAQTDFRKQWILHFFPLYRYQSRTAKSSENEQLSKNCWDQRLEVPFLPRFALSNYAVPASSFRHLGLRKAGETQAC